jgi:hypothetical protein
VVVPATQAEQTVLFQAQDSQRLLLLAVVVAKERTLPLTAVQVAVVVAVLLLAAQEQRIKVSQVARQPTQTAAVVVVQAKQATPMAFVKVVTDSVQASREAQSLVVAVAVVLVVVLKQTAAMAVVATAVKIVP